MFETNKIYLGDCINVLKTFPDKSINCCVTSPPYYGLRDYGVEGQIGNENNIETYINKLVSVFNEVKRVLTDDGTVWLNLGDSWSKRNVKGTISYKVKDLIGIPWLVAFALRETGWYLRQDIIWSKGNPMPESVTDRCTKSHEYIFLLSKSKRYYFDSAAIRENRVSQHGSGNKQRKQRPNADILHKGSQAGSIPYNGNETLRQKRDVWNVNIKPCAEAHFATFPDTLIAPCILAGCPIGGIVLDPFMGAGTTGMVAKRNNRNYIGIELNLEYIKIAEERIQRV